MQKMVVVQPAHTHVGRPISSLSSFHPCNFNCTIFLQSSLSHFIFQIIHLCCVQILQIKVFKIQDVFHFTASLNGFLRCLRSDPLLLRKLVNHPSLPTFQLTLILEIDFKNSRILIKVCLNFNQIFQAYKQIVLPITNIQAKKGDWWWWCKKQVSSLNIIVLPRCCFKYDIDLFQKRAIYSSVGLYSQTPSLLYSRADQFNIKKVGLESEVTPPVLYTYNSILISFPKKIISQCI